MIPLRNAKFDEEAIFYIDPLYNFRGGVGGQKILTKFFFLLFPHFLSQKEYKFTFLEKGFLSHSHIFNFWGYPHPHIFFHFWFPFHSGSQMQLHSGNKLLNSSHFIGWTASLYNHKYIAWMTKMIMNIKKSTATSFCLGITWFNMPYTCRTMVPTTSWVHLSNFGDSPWLWALTNRQTQTDT